MDTNRPLEQPRAGRKKGFRPAFAGIAIGLLLLAIAYAALAYQYGCYWQFGVLAVSVALVQFVWRWAVMPSGPDRTRMGYAVVSCIGTLLVAAIAIVIDIYIHLVP